MLNAKEYENLTPLQAYEKGFREGHNSRVGHWIHRNDDFNDWLECSECEYGSEGEVKYGHETAYCPQCGSSMKGVRE
jgi:uncharacterized paraquat-inducible protein A